MTSRTFELRSRDTLSYGHVIRILMRLFNWAVRFCWIGRLLCVFRRPILLYVASYYHTVSSVTVTSVVRATPHTKRGPYSIVNSDRCSASHCNYQNRIRSVRIFANWLSVVSFNSTILVTWAIRTALRLNNIHQTPKTVRTLENTQNKM